MRLVPQPVALRRNAQNPTDPPSPLRRPACCFGVEIRAQTDQFSTP